MRYLPITMNIIKNIGRLGSIAHRVQTMPKIYEPRNRLLTD